MSKEPSPPGTEHAPETVAASYGVAQDTAFGAVVPPLYLSTTYSFEGFEAPRAYDYGRAGNPNRDMLADALAKLEGGAGAVITSSGMAAIDLVLGQLEADDCVVAPHDCYGGTLRLLNARAGKRQFHLKIVDQSNEDAFLAAIEGGAKLIIVETPSNPLMRVIDIGRVALLAKRAGARLVVDNTFLSPVLQTPLALGADYVIHSTTKYLNGHSDVVGGAVIAAEMNDVDALRDWANTTGVTGSPFDAWLTLRGLRTLFPRMKQQSRTAARIAEWLEQQSAVVAVHYPGLHSHAGHSIARQQSRGFGAMMSFELSGGATAVSQFLRAVRGFTLAESLGGVESLIAHPATMTHADMGIEARKRAGIGDGLLRLSIGLEHEEDLIAGLQQGLAAIS